QRFVLDFTEGYPESVVPVASKVLSTPDRRIDMLNVKYIMITAPGPEYDMFVQHPDRFAQVFKRESTVVFENKTALPRAFVVGAGGAQVVQGDKGQIEVIKQQDFDPLKTVVLDSLPKELVEA